MSAGIEYRLWEQAAPGALGSNPEDVPTLTTYSDPHPNEERTAVVVCPGGGYGGLAPHEGQPVAQWFESIGIRAFVLKYRLGPKYHHPVELGDAERAIRFVRAHGRDWGIHPNKIGVLGFSAGGHLASSVSNHNSPGSTVSVDMMDRVSSRPDFSILLYPVVTMQDTFTHHGSRENLLGKTPDPSLVEMLSNEKAVSLQTPPAFIFHTADDDVVPIENSLQYATALRGHRIPFELHVPTHGPHGFGLGKPGSELEWRALCERWLQQRGLL